MDMSALTQPVSGEAKEQIDNYSEMASRAQPEIEQDLMGGVDQASSEMLSGPTGFMGQKGAGVDYETLSNAINQRALKKYKANSSELGVDVQSMALQTRMKRLNEAAQLVNAEHQQNQQAAYNKYVQKLNRKRARAGVLGNILGIAGAVAGGMAGGPAGAMAGYQVGQGAGNAFGGG